LDSAPRFDGDEADDDGVQMAGEFDAAEGLAVALRSGASRSRENGRGEAAGEDEEGLFVLSWSFVMVDRRETCD
jgi:hypothetical protein